ncbi:hypothetical protein ACFVUT_10080, partial [Streptomyces sp. NPDC058051]
NQGAQIVEFVNAVLDAVIAIANGGSASVPKMVETALAASVPLLIGFLASLLGIGSLANKVKSVFHAVAKPVNRAIDKIVTFITKKGKALWNKLKGKGKDGDSKPGRGKSEKAIADADRVLTQHPTRESANRKIAAIGRRYATPLRLVVDSHQPQGDQVHVQTARTPIRSLAGLDPAKLDELSALQQEFIGLVVTYGGNEGRARKVCDLKTEGRNAAGAAQLDDFIRDMRKRAVKAVRDGGQYPNNVKDDMRRAALAYALKRNGIKGSPTEFTNHLEYFESHFKEMYEAERLKQQREIDEGVRKQPNKKEAALAAAAALGGDTSAVTSRLYRERAQVRAQGGGGVTAGAKLSDEKLVARIQAKAHLVTFSTPTAAAYHARKHGAEVPLSERGGRQSVVAWYHHAARQVISQDANPEVNAVGGGTRQVLFNQDVVDSAGDSITLTAMVFARHDGKVVMATFGSFLKR